MVPVVIEEVDVGLNVGSSDGLVVAVALVDAVQPSAHPVAVRLCGTAGERQKDGYDGQQMSHLEYLDSVDQAQFHAIGGDVRQSDGVVVGRGLTDVSQREACILREVGNPL